MTPRMLALRCADNYPLAATLFNAQASRGAIVMAGALGVPRRFYAAYASYLASRGYPVLTFDYRGSGDSVNGPVRGRDMRMEDWGRRDIEAALAWARQELQPGKLYLIGHSAGAQLPGLANASSLLDGMVLVAGSAPHLRHYPFRSWPMLAVIWYLLAPLLTWRRDNFPARQTGLGTTTVAAGVVRQWARWARTRDYMFDPVHRIDTTRYANLKVPVLSYCFNDDSYAPEQATNALLAHYPGAALERRIVPKPARGVLGHFGFFRDQHKETLWRESADWLDAQGGDDG